MIRNAMRFEPPVALQLLAELLVHMQSYMLCRFILFLLCTLGQYHNGGMS